MTSKMPLSTLQRLKNTLKEHDLKQASKALTATLVATKSITSMIDLYRLDVLSGTNKDDLKSDEDQVFREFSSLFLASQPTINLILDNNVEDSSETLLVRNLNNWIFEHENVLSAPQEIKDNFNTDQFLAKMFKNNQIKITCIQGEKTYYVFSWNLPPLPTNESVEKLIRLSNLDEPTKEQQKQYKEMYQITNTRYQANKYYLNKLEELISNRVLSDKKARQLDVLIRTLQVMFG